MIIKSLPLSHLIQYQPEISSKIKRLIFLARHRRINAENNRIFRHRYNLCTVLLQVSVLNKNNWLHNPSIELGGINAFDLLYTICTAGFNTGGINFVVEELLTNMVNRRDNLPHYLKIKLINQSILRCWRV